MWRTLQVVALLIVSLRAAAADVPAIPLIKTLDDLRHVAPVKLGDGSEVRIGITETPADGMPLRFVYCLPVDPNAKPANMGGDPEEWAGPVRVRVVRARGVEEVTGEVQADELAKIDGEAFYCTAIPVFNKGNFQVEVLGRSAKRDEPDVLIYQSTMEVPKGRVCYWHQFTEKPGDDYGVASHPKAARPRYSGLTRHSPAMMKPDAALDGLDAEHPLELSLDLSVAEPKLTVKCAEEMINSPDEHLLARWWVNGKPVPAEPCPIASERKLMQHGWGISFAKEIKLVFALPKNLGTLKAGDRVELQVMYSPAGNKPVFDSAVAEMGGPVTKLFVPRIVAHPATLPRLSQKLEFIVTAEMLPH